MMERSPTRTSSTTITASLLFMGKRDEELPLLEKIDKNDKFLFKPQGNDESSLPSTSVVSSSTNPTDHEESSLSSYQVPYDDANRHLAIVIAGTLWWYLYATYYIVNPNADVVAVDFYGLSETAIQGLGVYVTASQLAVYALCYKLARATTLRRAQTFVAIMTMLCIPADTIVTLVNPTGSMGITTVAFAEITMIFGTFLAHYLKKAAYREKPPQKSTSTAATTNQHEHGDDGILQTLHTYRPPMGTQATRMAVEFTRAFCAFTISTGAMGELYEQQQHAVATGGNPVNPISLASLAVVVVHMGVECTTVTLFPGANLARFDSYLVAEVGLYTIQMLAASTGNIRSLFGDSLIDQALFIWLFGSATAKVIFKLADLVGRRNWDAVLGLSDLDNGQARQEPS